MGFRNDDITQFIEDNGGTVSSSVSKNTTLVIYVKNDKTQNKLATAQKLGIATISKEDFEKQYMLK